MANLNRATKAQLIETIEGQEQQVAATAHQLAQREEQTRTGLLFAAAVVAFWLVFS